MADSVVRKDGFIDFNALIVEAHATAVEHGWWPPEGRDFAEQVANFHAEISEAWEEYRKGIPLGEIYYSCSCGQNEYHPDTDPNDKPEDFCGTIKPEGFTVELADLLIRLADTAGQYGWILRREEEGAVVPRMVAGAVNSLHKTVGSFCDYAEGHDQDWRMSWVVLLVIGFCNANNLPLAQALQLKLVYNRTRPFRHGGKLA